MTVNATVPAQSDQRPERSGAGGDGCAGRQDPGAARGDRLPRLRRTRSPTRSSSRSARRCPYNEHQWKDETGKIRGQILTHGWDSSNPQQYHGHMSFYVWDTSDPSGNNRHHPLNIFYGTRYAPDPASDPRFRSRIAWDHSYFDLMDSVLVMGDTEVYILNGKLATRPKTTIPAPTPAT